MRPPELVQSGHLRHSLRVQAQTETRDSHGGLADSGWATTSTEWGSIEPISGGQYEEAGQQKSQLTHRILMRYHGGLSGISPHTIRIQFGSRDFDVEDVRKPAEIDDYVILLCKEVVDG